MTWLLTNCFFVFRSNNFCAGQMQFRWYKQKQKKYFFNLVFKVRHHCRHPTPIDQALQLAMVVAIVGRDQEEQTATIVGQGAAIAENTHYQAIAVLLVQSRVVDHSNLKILSRWVDSWASDVAA
jgi:hypothetical protein